MIGTGNGSALQEQSVSAFGKPDDEIGRKSVFAAQPGLQFWLITKKVCNLVNIIAIIDFAHADTGQHVIDKVAVMLIGGLSFVFFSALQMAASNGQCPEF